jgi:hypothetical protein
MRAGFPLKNCSRDSGIFFRRTTNERAERKIFQSNFSWIKNLFPDLALMNHQYPRGCTQRDFIKPIISSKHEPFAAAPG